MESLNGSDMCWEWDEAKVFFSIAFVACDTFLLYIQPFHHTIFDVFSLIHCYWMLKRCTIHSMCSMHNTDSTQINVRISLLYRITGDQKTAIIWSIYRYIITNLTRILWFGRSYFFCFFIRIESVLSCRETRKKITRIEKLPNTNSNTKRWCYCPKKSENLPRTWKKNTM